MLFASIPFINVPCSKLLGCKSGGMNVLIPFMLQMCVSSQATGQVIQEKTPYENYPTHKNSVDVFNGPDACMGWNPRGRPGREHAAPVQLTRKASKVAIYSSTQWKAATETDPQNAFKSTHYLL